MSALMPFFTYYGGKNRAARQGRYPAPDCDRIVEPFAGSAGYSLAYPDRQVLLVDLDANIVDTWRYLIAADPRRVLALPDLELGQTVADLDDVEPAERKLIGWWLNKGSAVPKLRPSTFARQYPQGGPYWGQRVRERIAAQLPAIRHWRVLRAHWAVCPEVVATWFVDPPYSGSAGRRYRLSEVDYPALAEWCKSRRGQVVVCEERTADWLPFRPLYPADVTEGRQKPARPRVEAVWP